MHPPAAGRLNRTMPGPDHTPPASRAVLFVDDEQPMLELLKQLFHTLGKGAWRIHVANNTAKALNILQENKVDLVVVDMLMPVVDGAQFMQLLTRKHPALIKVALSGSDREEVRANALKNGAEMFLEKPRSPEGWETVFATVNELIQWKPQEGFRGVVRATGLQDVLQMECLARNSSVLEIATPQTRGQIFVRAGTVVHAQMGLLKGVNALNALLALKGGDFQLKPFSDPPETSIDGQWEFLLMEAARVRDELGQTPPTPAPTTADAPVPPADSPPSEEPATATIPAPDAVLDSSRTEEILVCSSHGDVLYEWHCGTLEARLRLLEFLATRVDHVGHRLPLGAFDRLEIVGPNGRIVTKLQPDHRLLVRSTRAPAA